MALSTVLVYKFVEEDELAGAVEHGLLQVFLCVAMACQIILNVFY